MVRRAQCQKEWLFELASSRENAAQDKACRNENSEHNRLTVCSASWPSAGWNTDTFDMKPDQLTRLKPSFYLT